MINMCGLCPECGNNVKGAQATVTQGTGRKRQSAAPASADLPVEGEEMIVPGNAGA